MKHSILPPSSAARRVQCPGSRRMEEQFPDIETEESKEGTLAHAVAAGSLTGDFIALPYDVTQEMIEGAQLYRDDIYSIETHIIRPFFLVECRLNMTAIHADAFGTCDYFCYDENNRKLYIWDYKFGHKYVSAFENWQMIYYALGAIETFDLDPKKIVMTIVQPRYYGIEGKIRRFEMDRQSLAEYANILKEVEFLSMFEDSPLRTGSECQYCSARHMCAELQHSTTILSHFSQQSSSNELTPQQLGNELSQLLKAEKLLKARISGLSQEAETRLIEGKRVPGFLLKPGRSNQIWDKSVNEVIEMGNLLGINLAKPIEAITPKQAIAKNIPEKIISEYSKIIPGEMKLTEDKK